MQKGRRFAFAVAGLVAASAVLGPTTSGQAPVKRAVWAPLFDQWAQYSQLTLGDMPAGHPEFPMGTCRDRYRRSEIQALVRSSLDAAHARGARSIDVMFFFDEVMFGNGVPQVPNREPCPPYAPDPNTPFRTDPPIQGLIDIGVDWVSAVENFNTTCVVPGCERLALRLRLVPTPQTLAYFRSTDPSAYAALPPPVVCDPNDRNCDPVRPYRAWVSVWNPGTSRFDRSQTSEVLDLGQVVIRQHVGLWLDRIVERVGQLAPATRIESVSLALDIGGESSLFSSKGITGFSNMVEYGRISGNVEFFRKRQDFLKATYAAFGSAAQARGVPAAVFYQSWVLDDTVRGAFDLHDLLSGTGIRALHHTVWPRNPLATTSAGLSDLEHRMIVAPSATAARKLGLEMDTELSWDWYYPPGTFFSGGMYRWLNESSFGGRWGTHDVGDFNADRLTDILFREVDQGGNHNFYVALSNGFGFVASGRWLQVSSDPGAFLGIADFNGDGRDDLLFRPAAAIDELAVSLAQGNGFASPSRWAAPGAFGGETGYTYVGDFTGDGRADVLFQRIRDDSMHVAPSSGTRFEAAQQWVGSNDFGGDWGRYLVGDFNGDRRDDLLFIESGAPNPNTIHVSISTGSGFFAPGSGVWKGSNGFGGLWGRHYVGNFDGQGGEDLMFFEPSNRTVHVALAKEGFFQNAGVWLDPNHFGGNMDRYLPGDFTGYFETDAAGNPVGKPDGLVDLGYLDFERGEFYVAKTATGESTVYNAFLRSDDNALAFHNQALAGLKFGAAGVVYAQWATGDMRAPADSTPWRAIIGPVTPGSDHLFGTGGLFVPPNSTPLPAARKAIFLSTLGKMQCEQSGTCRFGDYLRWFSDFGLTGEVQSRQVDVLTDQMVIQGSLGQYDTILLPFETSSQLATGVCEALVRKHRNVRRQVSKGSKQTTRVLRCPF